MTQTLPVLTSAHVVLAAVETYLSVKQKTKK